MPSSRPSALSRLFVLVFAVLLAAPLSVVPARPVSAAASYALQLNGSSQYATLGNATQLRSATFTVELWFKRTGAGIGTGTGSGGINSAIPLITKGRAEAENAAADVNYFLGIDASTGKLVADFEEGQTGTAPSANHPVTGTAVIAADSTWHHAAATYDGTTWNLYLDGQIDGTSVVGRPANAQTNVPTTIGSALTTAGVAAGYFAGAIDEVRIWSVARTQAQIQATKDVEITSAQTGLAGAWNLNAGSGSALVDSSGASVSGSTVTSLADSSGGSATGATVAGPPWVSGFASYALQLNGSSQYATLGNATQLRSATFTVELWFKRTGAGIGTGTGSGGINSAIPLITKGRAEAENAAADVNYFLGIDASTGKLVADFEEGQTGTAPSANHPVTGTAVIAADSTWHHAAATYDGTTWNLYLDGQIDGTSVVGRPANAQTNVPTTIGSALTTAGVAAGYFAGAIDEVRIWSVARTQAQIQATKDVEITSAQTGLAGAWNLNAGSNASWVEGFPADTTPPAAPSGLTATPGDGQVSLAWTANTEPDLAGYNVYRSTTTPVTTGSTKVNGTTLLTSASFTDSGRTNGSTYYYAVTAVDGQGNESALSAERTATPVPAAASRALDLGSGSGYVTFGDPAKLDLATFTIETWFKRTGTGTPDTTGGGGIAHLIPLVTHGSSEVDALDNRDADWILGIDADSNKLAADFEDMNTGLNHPVTGATVVTSNVWHHVAATYDGQTWKLYLDGNLDATLAITCSPASVCVPRSDSIQPAALGAMITSTGVIKGHFTGILDEVRVWDLARTRAQIDADLNRELAAGAGLVARWALDEGYGATVADSIAPTVGGTITGSGTGWAPPAPFNAAPDTTAPAAPSGLAATPGDAEVSLAWTANAESDLAGYNVYRATTTPVTKGTPVNGTTLLTSPTFTDAGLSNGTTYSYAVTAVDGQDNESALSAERSATPMAVSATNHALDLGTSGAYVTFGNPAKLGLGTFTLETWFKREGTGVGVTTGTNGIASAIPLVTHGSQEAETPAVVNMDWFLGIDASSGTLVADFEEATGPNHPVSGTAVVTSNVWHHAAATYDGTTWRLYLDGVLDGTAVANTTPQAATSQPAGLGTSIQSNGTANGFFDGVLDEARVWSRALSASEIAANVNAELTGGTGLVARWGLNESSGTSVGDSIAPAAGGTVTGTGTSWVSGAPLNVLVNAAPVVDAGADQTTSVGIAVPLSGSVSDDGRPEPTSLTVAWSKVSGPGDVAFANASSASTSATFSAVGTYVVGLSAEDSELTTSDEVTVTVNAASDVVMVGAGDIGQCGGSAAATGSLVNALPTAVVYTTGDNAYPDGSATDFANCYDPSWGSFKARTHPSIGNHDAANATTGYYPYFGASSVGSPNGWYSYDLGPSWHAVVLNSETEYSAGSAQELWLRADLASNESKNVIAYWHRPRFDSGATHGTEVAAEAIWRDLYEFGADLVVNGHEHWYERFAPQTPDGVADSAHGIREFVVGTGGGSLYGLGTLDANSEVHSSTYGVLKLTLHASSYDWQFVPVAGSTYTDAGTQAVHDAPPASTTNHGLDLGAGTAYVTFADPAKLDLGTFTIETWFKREGAGTAASSGTNGVSMIPLVSHGAPQADASNVDENWILGINGTTGTLAADFEDMSSGSNHPVSGSTAITSNVWHHAAATYDGTIWRLYLDGVLDGTLAANAAPRSDTIQLAGLGTMLTSTGAANGHFDGVLDEARVWSRALSASEIAANVNAELTGGTGLVARWGLNESSGTSVGDSIAPAATGTVTGSGTSWVSGAPLNIVINHAPSAPAVVAPANGATGVSTSPTLSVTASDPDADALDVSFYGRAATASGSDFTIVALPDTQYYSQTYPATFLAQTQWVVAQQASRNIVFVTHEGDVVNDGDTVGQEYQWTNGNNAMSVLDGHVPYAIAPGNHDEVNGTTQFNAHFGVSRYAGQPWYGGHYGTTNQNSYELFDASGMRFLILHLEYAPSAAVLSWAQGVVTAHPDRRVILTTHDYLSSTGARDANGDAIWNGLVNGTCSIFLVLSGHNPGSASATATNSCGGTVQQQLADYQSLTGGGSGYLRYLTFHPATDTVDVRTYSPTLGTYLTGGDQFAFSYDMTGGASFAQVGTAQHVSSGGTASVAWAGLGQGTGYEWYATVSDGVATTTGATSSFTTAVTPATAPGAPTIGTAAPGNAQATVTWTAPASTGGSPITGYVVTPYAGTTAGTPTPVGNVLTASVTGLTNGTAYTFKVAAVNAVGTGPQSAASNAVTPATVPGAPTIGTAAPGNAQATVTWTAPASTGGSPITGYVVTPHAGTTAGTPTPVGNLLTASVTGLTNGTAYTFKVAAVNAVGTGPQSAASNAVTPRVIVFRGASFAQTSGATSLTIQQPSGTQSGDVLLAAVAPRSGFVVTPPVGWSLERRDPSGTTIEQALFVHVASSSAPASFTFTFSSSAAVGMIAAYDGVDEAAPVDQSSGAMSTASGITAPSLMVTSADDVLVGIFSIATTASFTSPSSMLERGETSVSGKTKVSLELADGFVTLSGPTGTRTATADKSGTGIGQLVALRPSGIPRQNQTITFTSTAPSNATVGGQTYRPTATATSGLAVALTVDGSASTVCAISGGVVSFTGPGMCVIDANQAGNASFNPAPQVQQSLTVTGSPRQNQTITFTSTAPSNATVGGQTYRPTAIATSGLAVALTVDGSASTVCAISGGVVSFTGPGMCVIDANQAGNASFNPAPQVQQSFTVTATKQTATSTVVAAAPNPSVFGSMVTFTATVTGSGGVVSGALTFSEGGTTLSTVPLASGTATWSTSSLSVGNHTITATYSGESTFAGSTGTVRQSVKRK